MGTSEDEIYIHMVSFLPMQLEKNERTLAALGPSRDLPRAV
jgi:hypothetical protein